MVKMVALYKPPQDAKAFDAHYFGTHKALAEKIPGLKDFKISKVFGGPNGKEFYLMAELAFENRDAFKAGMRSPESQAAAADIPNFAPGLVSIFFAEEVPVPAA